MASDPPFQGGTILGLDNVQVELPLAGIGSRSMAAAIDHLVLLALQLLWLMAATTLASFSIIEGNAIPVVMVVGFFLLQWGYFAALEMSTGGKTPGKTILGLRVVSHVGGRASATALLIRNFIRTFDILIGVPLMAVDRRCRRLGDMLAATIVIHEQKASDDLVEVRRFPPSWGGREVAVVESFLARAHRLEGDKASQMADQLLDWIRSDDPLFWAEVEPEIVWSHNRVLVLAQVVKASTQGVKASS